jgi:SHS2 domain-containing protein
MVEGWRTFEHTADLGLEVWAETPERLHALAALALLAQVVEPPAAPPGPPVRVEVEGDEPADLLVHWLNTALLEAEIRGVTWTACRVERLSARALAAELRGVGRDPGTQVFLREIKAVSHHALELDLAPGRCRCRLVLDL